MKYISALPSQEWSGAPAHHIVLLGSTGSIGCSTLEVIARHPQRLKVTALAGGRNVKLLAEQAATWRPPYVAMQDKESAIALRDSLPAGYKPKILVGQEGFMALSGLPEADTVLSAQVGAAGLRSTLAAIRAGKVVCVANKESLVLAGHLMREECARTGAVILPVDSEHNAVFQAILGRPDSAVRRIILTASGGPFRGWPLEKLYKVTAEQALRHPNWDMGAKISIDSATLMNKGLEVLEAHALYAMSAEEIAVTVHPQSIVHSLVELTDGSCMAQMGTPNMRIPIAQCINWPHYEDVGVPLMNLATIGSLTFEEPDLHSFPCLGLALKAMEGGGMLPVTLNAANEVAVDAFLGDTIDFMDIPHLIEEAMDADSGLQAPGSIDAILEHDALVRDRVRKSISSWRRGSHTITL